VAIPEWGWRGPLKGAPSWSKRSRNTNGFRIWPRSDGLIKRVIVSSGVVAERQLAWASREPLSPTECRSWEFLAHRSDGRLARAPNLCLLIIHIE